MDNVYRLDLVSGRTGESRSTPQGGLLADATLTRTGVFEYRTPDGGVRRELRPPEEVFAKDSLASYKGAPVTIDHPGRVGPHNWKEHAVGHLDDADQDGDFVRGGMRLQHGGAVDQATSGKVREISMGYTCDLDPTPGEYKGEKYDAVQRNIRVNHAALLPPGAGRMGPEARLHLDSSDAVSGAQWVEPDPAQLEAQGRHDAQVIELLREQNGLLEEIIQVRKHGARAPETETTEMGTTHDKDLADLTYDGEPLDAGASRLAMIKRKKDAFVPAGKGKPAQRRQSAPDPNAPSPTPGQDYGEANKRRGEGRPTDVPEQEDPGNARETSFERAKTAQAARAKSYEATAAEATENVPDAAKAAAAMLARKKARYTGPARGAKKP